MHLPHVTPFAKNPLYFFTACIVNRRPILACAESARILEAAWQNSAQHDGWFIGRYVIMPDHVHLFAMPVPEAKRRADWCKTWKSVSSRQICRTLGIAPPLWQPDTFDHILRNKESYSEKWDYVQANPVRAGLVQDPVDWPWRGEINSLAF